MKTNRFAQVVFATIVILSMAIVSGCGGSSGGGMPSIDLKAIGARSNKYFSEGVELEKNVTNKFRNFEMSMNRFRTGARDLIANQAQCVKSVAETEAAVAEAVMGNQDSEALFSGLMTQSVSGEQATTECVQLFKQTADYTIANRKGLQDDYMSAFEAATEYMAYTSKFIDVDIMNDLMSTMLDTAKVYEFLAEHGVGVSDWSWLPTSNLWVSHTDKDLCDYYTSGEFMDNVPYSMKMKFTGHEDALARLYESSWNPAANGGRGECRMTRYAALEYMTRSIVSSDTRDVIETGEDSSIYSTPTPSGQ